jgi:hypothetical protein
MAGIMSEREINALINFELATGDSVMNKQIKTLLSSTLMALAGATLVSAPVQAANKSITFPIIRSAGSAPVCAPYAKGVVKVTSLGSVEVMDVWVSGLPRNIDLDAFIIQVPNKPFGMSWYQGDIHTNQWGNGYARFVGRFNKETFVVAPKPAIAPRTHAGDAATNPATPPIHTYHVGIWFNSPRDARNAGCAGDTTPFNGEHNAGVQILNSGTYLPATGPLLKLEP